MGLYRVTRVIEGKVEDLTVEAPTGPEAGKTADRYKADAEVKSKGRKR